VKRLVRHELGDLSGIDFSRISCELETFITRSSKLIRFAMSFYFLTYQILRTLRLPLEAIQIMPGLAQVRRLVRTRILLSSDFIASVQEVQNRRTL
jgi:hypothetical protein